MPGSAGPGKKRPLLGMLSSGQGVAMRALKLDER